MKGKVGLPSFDIGFPGWTRFSNHSWLTLEVIRVSSGGRILTVKLLDLGSGVVFLEKLSSEVAGIGAGLLDCTLNLFSLIATLLGVFIG